MTKRENPRRRENIEKKKNRREMSRTEYVSKGNRANTQGYGVAQYKLGKLHLTGEEIPKDMEIMKL